MRAARRLVLAISAFTLIWPLAGYPATLWLIARLRSRRRPPEPLDDRALPAMTVVLPTYQEAATVTKRLRNIAACRYPRELLDVIVVDSGSTDGTVAAVESFMASSCELRVRLIRQPARAGKASATNAAIVKATGDLVTVTDAPTTFEPEALRRVAARFADPSVGAATGKFEVTGDGGPLQREEARFWRMRHSLRALEAAVDSTPFLSGELCCFRRALVPRLDEDTLADDMNIAMQVRRQGYRVVVCDDASFSEPRSGTAHELIETKSRRAAGGVQELLRGRDMLFSRKHGLFGLLILPSAFLYYLPLRVPALAIVAWSALRPLRRLALPVQVLAALAIGGAAAAVVTSRREHLGMLLFNEWIFLLGWRRLLLGKMDVRWAQERTTRAAAARDAEAAR